MIMIESAHGYQPVSKEVTEKIRKNWKEYKDLFDLEGQVYYDLLQARASESLINQKLSERKALVSSLIEDYHNSIK